MQPTPKHSSHKEPFEPASQKLALGIPAQALGDDAELSDCLMGDVIFKLRVNQLVTTLRATQQLDAESNTMLTVLESLVVAGEIPFSDFIQRVQNLFPHVFDEIAPELRDNLLRMLRD